MHPTRAVACCYRLTPRGPQILLVRTRAGAWTVPGGRVESMESPATAAAREAMEEAGVEGELDPDPVAWVRVRKGVADLFGGAATRTPVFMLEVIELSMPHEDWRRPTWMPAREAESELRRRRPWSQRWRAIAVKATLDRIAAS